jgi:hypothetical protein
VRLLTGDVALALVTESDRPVVVLPDREEASAGEADADTAADRVTDRGDDG